MPSVNFCLYNCDEVGRQNTADRPSSSQNPPKHFKLGSHTIFSDTISCIMKRMHELDNI